MASAVHKWKPAASARVHLLLAALMWTGVGSALIIFGSEWVLSGHYAHPSLLLLAAVAVGLLKSRLVLDRTAGRIIERIRRRGDGRCLGGFLSVRTWMVVLVMMICGRLLRSGPLDYPVIGLVYAAVGSALLLSARSFWWAWHLQPKPGRLLAVPDQERNPSE